MKKVVLPILKTPYDNFAQLTHDVLVDMATYQLQKHPEMDSVARMGSVAVTYRTPNMPGKFSAYISQMTLTSEQVEQELDLHVASMLDLCSSNGIPLDASYFKNTLFPASHNFLMLFQDAAKDGDAKVKYGLLTMAPAVVAVLGNGGHVFDTTGGFEYPNTITEHQLRDYLISCAMDNEPDAPIAA